MEPDARAEPLRPRPPLGCRCGEAEGVSEGWGGRPCPVHPAPPRCEGEHAWICSETEQRCAACGATRGPPSRAEIEESYDALDALVCAMVHPRRRTTGDFAPHPEPPYFMPRWPE